MPNPNLAAVLHFVGSLAIIATLAALAAVGTITSAVALPPIGLIVGQLLGIAGFSLGSASATPSAVTTASPSSPVISTVKLIPSQPSPGSSAPA